jgi:hypothetical protein
LACSPCPSIRSAESPVARTDRLAGRRVLRLGPVQLELDLEALALRHLAQLEIKGFELAAIAARRDLDVDGARRLLFVGANK